MLLPVGDYYAVVDASGEKKNLTVIYESDNRRDAEEARDRLKMVGCEVYAEVGGRIYRVICPQTKVKSDYVRP